MFMLFSPRPVRFASRDCFARLLPPSSRNVERKPDFAAKANALRWGPASGFRKGPASGKKNKQIQRVGLCAEKTAGPGGQIREAALRGATPGRRAGDGTGASAGATVARH